MITSTDEPLSSSLPITKFLQEILKSLEVQAGVDAQKTGAHPDPAIREFNQGLLAYLSQGAHFEFLSALSKVYQARLEKDAVDPGHFVDLIARAVQYLHRRELGRPYLPNSAEQWLAYFDELPTEELDELIEVLIEKQVATHILARYRGLAALGVLLQRQLNLPLRLADLGCSLNLGLPLALHPAKVLAPEHLATFEDGTPEALITELLATSKLDFVLR